MSGYSKMAFATRFRCERVALKNHAAFSITAGAAPATVTINHALGYVPFFRLYYSFDVSGTIYPLFTGPASFNIDGNSCQIDSVSADNSTITVTLENDAASGTVTGKIYYRIYAESMI